MNIDLFVSNIGLYISTVIIYNLANTKRIDVKFIAFVQPTDVTPKKEIFLFDQTFMSRRWYSTYMGSNPFILSRP